MRLKIIAEVLSFETEADAKKANQRYEEMGEFYFVRRSGDIYTLAKIMDEDTRTVVEKFYYVSAMDGSKKYLVAGPYVSHDRALDRVEAVRTIADERDPRAHFMAWGTAGSREIMETPFGVDY